MTDWEALELKPLKLADIPSDMEWCVYPEERERGEVLLPETAYMVVLALRWILTYTSWGYEDDFETWKVYWKNEDKYGFKVRIFLFREKVEQYDYDDEPVVLQPQTWVELATLRCSNGQGVINEVVLPAAEPYGGDYSWQLQGVAGVQRLLEDAIYASRATHNWQPIRRLKDGWTNTWRVQGNQDHDGWELDFKLETDHDYMSSYVTAVSLRTREPSRW